MLVAVLTKLLGEFWMGEQISNLISTAFHRVHEDAGQLMNYLSWNPTDGARDRRLRLP